MKLAVIAVISLALNSGSALSHRQTQSIVGGFDGPRPPLSKAQKATKAYAEYREVESTPSFGLGKVKAILKSIGWEGAYTATMLSNDRFAGMSVGEKFTYCMLNGEANGQICSGMPVFLGEQNFIFAYPATKMYTFVRWSDRQRHFMESNRAAVVSMLRETIHANPRVGRNVKQAVIDLKARDLIPDLLTMYQRDRKDKDILSTCMVLMHEAHYQPFLKTAICRKLFDSERSYRNSYIESTPAAEKLIIEDAIGFAKTKGA